MRKRYPIFFLWFNLLILNQTSGQTLTLDVDKLSLDSVILLAEQQLKIQFVYSKELIELCKPVSFRLKKSSLDQFLHACLVDQPVSFFRNGKYIVLQALSDIPGAALRSNVFSAQVLDENNQPLTGTTIQVKNSKKSVQADHEGRFSIQLGSINDTLIISCIGHQSLQVNSNSQQQSTFILKRNIFHLEETVVKGYYSTPTYSNTGAVKLIKKTAIEHQPVVNILSAIQGRVAGVYIKTENGLPGGNISIRIRGPNSLQSGNDPLFLLDGIPFEASPLNENTPVMASGMTGLIHPLSIIPAEEIESISFLKDADATALYGARAGNGVVLINTKKPSQTKPQITVNIQQGVSQLSHFTKLLNLQQYLDFRMSAFLYDSIQPTTLNAPELLVWDTTKSNNWQKYLFGQMASFTNISAGGKASFGNSSYYTNFTLHKQGSVSPGNNLYWRSSIHFNYSYNHPLKPFRLLVGILAATDRNKQMAFNAASSLTLPPNIPLFTENNQISWSGFTTNAHPYALQHLRSNSTTNFLQPSLKFEFQLFPSLQVKLNTGCNYIQLSQELILPKKFLNPTLSNKGLPTYAQNIHQYWIIEPQLEFKRKLATLEIQSLIGTSLQSGLKSGITSVDNTYNFPKKSEYRYAAAYAQLLLSWNKRVSLNMVLRRDASSRFGPNNRIGNFGSLGFSWMFKQDKIHSASLLSFGKLRASFGYTGNDQIGDFSYLSTYSQSIGYNSTTGWQPDRFPNHQIGWEKIRKLEVALDVGLLCQRLQGTLALYYNHSSNQVLPIQLPAMSGPFRHYLTNTSARLLNQGLEWDAGIEILKTCNWSWVVDGNISIPTNKLLAFPSNSLESEITYETGEDITIRKGFRFLGINSADGLPVFKDFNGDNLLNKADHVVIGKTTPDYFGGLGTSLKFKGMSISLFFQFVKKLMHVSVQSPGGNSNQFVESLNRWQQPGDVTGIPAASNLRTVSSYQLANSSASFMNASFCRFKSGSISYSLPDCWLKRLKLKEMKCYTEATNLFIWQKKGNYFDPETNYLGVPPIQTITLGIQIKII